ncbi:FRG domain-containing protein [Burkholderia pseudomallei]|uniref:FRG domain-containing protein n=1 Tax=Burkholderia pseudomallei TaxID=28450 RepID=UPI0009B0D181|nr:FRG domain-containing protein [Burkholderia pseudomallei]
MPFFRGHADSSYLLKPSLFRQREHRKEEKDIIRELITLHPSEFNSDESTFEKLVRMQHYSLPTRLLDLTYNPLIALYFACSSNPKSDAEFIRFSIAKDKIRYSDSDTVSCIANLANLRGYERDEIRDMSDSEELAKSEVGERLLHFIKAEKSYFLPKIKISDLKGIIAVKPKLNNRRILAQQGAFLIYGLTSNLEDGNRFGIRIRRHTIKSANKPAIMSQLDKINVNVSTVFPEIEYAAKYITSKLPTAPKKPAATGL